MPVSKPKTVVGYRKFLGYLREVGLLEDVVAIALRHAVTIRDLFLGGQHGQSLRAARLETWWWLAEVKRKSTAEIGRLFERDATTISTALKRLGQHAEEMGAELTADRVVDVACDLSRTKVAALQESGRRVARLGLAKRAASG